MDHSCASNGPTVPGQKDSSAIDWKAKLSSLTQAVVQINGTGSLESVLVNLVTTACKQVGWAMGSIMSISAEHGFAYVMARHDPNLLQRELRDRWELATSPSLMALQRNQQIYIRDARESAEFPAYRIEAFERDYRSVLVVPMNCADFEGRPMVLSLLSRQVSEISEDDQAILDMVVQLGVAAVEQERRVQAARQEAARQEKALSAHKSLLDHALADNSVPLLCKLLENLLQTPVVVVDFTVSQVVGGRTPDPARFDDETWQAEVRRVYGTQIAKIAREAAERATQAQTMIALHNGADTLQLAARIQPLVVDADKVGAMVIFTQVREPDILELMILDSARFALSVVMMRNFIRFRFEKRSQAELFFEVIERRWRDKADLLMRAQRQGLDFSRRQQMLIVDFESSGHEFSSMAINLHRALSQAVQAPAKGISVLAVDGAMICLCPVGPENSQAEMHKLAQRAARELSAYLDKPPVVVLSAVCADLPDYAEAWERSRRVVAIARSMGKFGALSMQDFGPMPMLAAAAGVDEVRLFLDDVLGQIIEYDREKGTPYLETLEIFLREQGRSQATADAMGLHVTTLRYRLKRIEELFGINVEAPERRFAVDLAIRLYKMIAPE